jgi:hypothetical protein
VFFSVAVGMATFGLVGLPNLLFRLGFDHHSSTRKNLPS